MAWTTISNALVAVGAKPFATTIQALRDNPVAIADGDVNAPRVVGAALLTHRPNVSGSGAPSTPDGWTDLGRVRVMRFDYTFIGGSTTSGTTLQWRFSVNAGSSWSSYVNGPAATTLIELVHGALWLNLSTGEWRSYGPTANSNANGTTAPPGGGVNGLQFRINGGSGSGSGGLTLNIAGHILSGVTP